MSTSWSLSKALRKKAKAFFHCDFSDVRIHISLAPSRVGATAYAHGNSIYLMPHILCFSEQKILEILGHELAHIAQQRQGRVAPTSSDQGYFFNSDPVLEEEADNAGRHFSCDQFFPWPAFPEKTSTLPVIQKAIVLGKDFLSDTANLSQNASLVLDLIPMGWDWLDWAISNPTLTISLPDENTLLKSIQAGLHGSELLLLKQIGLLIDPTRLASLPQNDLETLVTAEKNNQSTTQVKTILKNNQFLVQSNFSQVSQYLNNLEIQDQPVFQDTSFSDQIAMFNWYNGLNSALAPFGKEAAQFALEYAQTPAAFINYYQFFLALGPRIENWQDDSRKRARTAQKLLEGFTPSLPLLLRSPMVGHNPAPQQLFSMIGNWIDGGNHIGFNSASSAVLQVTQNTNLSQPQDIQEVLNSYMFEANKLLRNTQPGDSSLSQDGITQTYILKTNEAYAKLVLDVEGILTLGTFYVTEQYQQLQTQQNQFFQALKNKNKTTQKK